jgi:hypothetical protein
MSARGLLLAALLTASAARGALAHGTVVQLSAAGGKPTADQTY